MKSFVNKIEFVLNLFYRWYFILISGIFLILSFIRILTHGEHGSALEAIMHKSDSMLDFALVPLFFLGLPILYNAIYYLITEKGISKITSAVLISTAMITATALGDIFAAGEVAFLMAVGEKLETLAYNRAKKSLNNLIKMQPDKANLIVGSEVVLTEIKDIKTGDKIRILPGERVPVDGKIISGNTNLDQAILTGESLPVFKDIGDEVFTGSINTDGSIDVVTTKTGEDNSLKKLIKLINEAEENRAPTARTVDKIASILVPVAILIAVLVFIISGDIIKGATILVVFCPCALVLATPTAIVAATQNASRNGVIIKSGEALENMGKVNKIFFDKTGTITKGNLKVADIVLFNVQDEIKNTQDLLKAVASAEMKSEHPIAKAIINHAKEEGIENYFEINEFKALAGKGLVVKINEVEYCVGNEKLLSHNTELKIESNIDEKITELKNEGKALIILAKKDNILGLITLLDELKEEAKTVISDLKQNGVKTIMLSGDNKEAVNYFKEKILIDEAYSNLLPEDKLSIIKKSVENNNTVAMVGDGVNDAPSLKLANVGISMGSLGSDVAIEVSDIALMNDDIGKISYLRKLSKITISTIYRGIIIAMGFNFISITLSILGVLVPTTGALVHNVSSIFVILLASGLYKKRITKTSK